ncbi:sugar phosphate isomerase/epimerase [archaeon]|nr:sugar phosphate isomerase/epimerase [archaeon]
MGDSSYESFYQGGPSSMSPEYGNGTFTGYRMGAGQLASTTGIGTANQLNEVVSRIKEGVKNVELQPLAGDVFDQIPKQHWQEMQALMKLSGVKASVHSPVINPAGFGQKGWEGEQARLDVERRFNSVMEKAHILDPNGNTPVVFHSTEAVQGATYIPGDKDKGEDRFKKVEEIAINVDTGEMTLLKEKRQFNPFKSEDLQGDPVRNKDSGTLFTIESSLHSANETTWDNSMTQIATLQKQADEVLGPAYNVLESFKGAKEDQLSEDELIRLKSASERVENSQIFLDNMRLNVTSSFDKLYEFGSDAQRKELEELSKNVKMTGNPVVDVGTYKKLVKGMHEITQGINPNDPTRRDENFSAPKMFKPLEEFAMEKTAKTFGNVAWEGYDKFGDNSPIVAMENMYAGMPFSRAEDMKKLVEESKKVFVENAVKKGMDRSTAKNKADKLIGVTWDVGHLNVMKKKGFTDKDVISETKKIKDVVKHIHLTDNFGYGDSHLAPGMGNVPIKEILQQLEKNGDFKKMRKVIEAGALVTQGSGLGMSPHAWTVKAFGSPIYGMQNSTYWNQAGGMMGSYFSGYGDSNPSTHHSIYGSGFTTLPRELGGNIPGTNSRFSGTPNA